MRDVNEFRLNKYYINDASLLKWFPHNIELKPSDRIDHSLWCVYLLIHRIELTFIEPEIFRWFSHKSSSPHFADSTIRLIPVGIYIYSQSLQFNWLWKKNRIHCIISLSDIKHCRKRTTRSQI